MGVSEEYHDIASSLQDLPRVARGLLSWMGSARLVRFASPMGSGKTTLIAAICHELGVRDRVSSPTFAIMNEYGAEDGGTVFHFDFYRIEKEEDLLELGLSDVLLDDGAWRLVEWPAVGEALMPSGGVDVEIEVMQDGARRVRAVKREK